MANNFHESLSEDAVELPSERTTGLVFSGVAAVVAVIWRANPTVLTIAAAAAVILLLVAIAAPSRLKTLNVVWFKIGQALHHVMSPLIMGLLYLIAIVPLGLLMQRFRDPLRSRRDTIAATYWIDRRASPSPQTPMTEQF